MRKETDDVIARSVAENQVGDLLIERSRLEDAGNDRDDAVTVARNVLREFPAVEFEKATSKVRGGPDIPVRRLVITGAWEVDPFGIQAADS